MEYRLIGDHPEDLTGGGVVGPGEFVELDEEQLREPHIEELVAQGKLIPTDDQGEHEAKLAARRAQTKQTKQAEEGGGNTE